MNGMIVKQDVIKELRLIKAQLDIKTLNDVLRMLLDKYKESATQRS